MTNSPGLYVHVPFCSAICPYCDFAVLPGNSARAKRYAARLLEELAGISDDFGAFDTLYFGGGTPSFLLPELLGRLVEELGKKDRLTPDCRIYLEANPEDVDAHSVAAWRDMGVHTLSLGVQALDDDSLSWLGRRHTADEARRAVELARDVGFDCLSFDLIYGFEAQSLADWRETLLRAVALEPDHLSCYELTVHEGTLFGRRRREGHLREVSSDTQGDLFRLTHRLLADEGLEGYEVSNFARSTQYQSRQNEKYWSHAPYLGLGPSAHSFAGNRRWWNVRTFFAWEKRLQGGESPVADRESLDSEAMLLESLMLRFRTRRGLDLIETRACYGVNLEKNNSELVDQLVADGLVTFEPPWLRPTLDGLAVADSLSRAFDLTRERYGT